MIRMMMMMVNGNGKRTKNWQSRRCFCLWIFDYLCALFNVALVEEEEEKINKVN